MLASCDSQETMNSAFVDHLKPESSFEGRFRVHLDRNSFHVHISCTLPTHRFQCFAALYQFPPASLAFPISKNSTMRTRHQYVSVTCSRKAASNFLCSCPRILWIFFINPTTCANLRGAWLKEHLSLGNERECEHPSLSLIWIHLNTLQFRKRTIWQNEQKE